MTSLAKTVWWGTTLIDFVENNHKWYTQPYKSTNILLVIRLD